MIGTTMYSSINGDVLKYSACTVADIFVIIDVLVIFRGDHTVLFFFKRSVKIGRE